MTDIDDIVVDRLRTLLTDRRESLRLVDTGDGSAAALQLAITAGHGLAADLDAPARRRRLVVDLVADVQIADQHVAISVSRAALLGVLRIDGIADAEIRPADLLLTQCEEQLRRLRQPDMIATGTKIDEAGVLIRDVRAFYLRRELCGRYQLKLQRTPVDLVEKRVRLVGTLVGLDFVDADGVAPE